MTQPPQQALLPLHLACVSSSISTNRKNLRRTHRNSCIRSPRDAPCPLPDYKTQMVHAAARSKARPPSRSISSLLFSFHALIVRDDKAGLVTSLIQRLLTQRASPAFHQRHPYRH